MSLLKRSRRRSGPDPAKGAAAINVLVIEDTHRYEGEDGSIWWSAGYAPVYEDGEGEHHFIALGEHLCNGQVLYCKVAGSRHYGSALEDRRFEPGSTAQLRPEAGNPYDVNAVGVWDASGSLQVGHIPAEHSGEVASRLRSGEQLVGHVLREIRHGSKSGPRTTLHLLVMPAGELKLSILEKD